MKTAYLMMLLALTAATAAPTVPFLPAAPLPLSGQVKLLNAQEVAVLSGKGLLFTGKASGDVVRLQVQAGNGPETLSNFRLHTQPQRKLECFGPAGQRVVLKVPHLQEVEWVSANGRVTALRFK